MKLKMSSYSRLPSPITVGGQTYDFAVVFEADPPLAGGKKIVEAIVHAVDGNRIVFERGLQSGSWVIPPEAPGRGSTEIVYQSTTGGNVVDSFERDRVYSVFNNPMASRGSMASIRAIPGDALVLKIGTRRPMCEVVSINAYGHAPSMVDYNPSSAQNLQSYHENPGTGLQAHIDDIEGGTVVFGPHLTGVWYESTGLERVIYDDDEFSMPDNLTLPVDHYWYNPISHEIRFSSEQPDALMNLSWWIRILPSIGVREEDNQQFKWTDGGDPESIAGITIQNGDFDVTISIIPVEDLEPVFRIGTPGDQGAFIQIDHENAVLAFGWRTDGGAYSTAEFDFSGYTPTGGAVAIRAQRISNVLKIWVDDELVLEEELRGGVVVGMAGAIWHFTNAGENDYHVFGECSLHVWRSRQASLQPGAELILPADYAQVSIRNLSADASNMVLNGSGRLGYAIDGNKRLFNREAEGDLVNVGLEYIGSGAGDPPGLAFRIYEGQEGFSTIDEDGRGPGDPPVATTDVQENRANWFDECVIANPLGIDIQPGDQVEVWRGVNFMPADGTYSFEIAEDPEDDTPSPISGFFDPASGVLLLKSSDIPFEEFEIRGRFSRRYRTGCHAEAFNEQKQVVEALDNAWASGGNPGGAPIGFHGTASQMWGPEQHVIRDLPGDIPTFWPSSYKWGLDKSGLHGQWIWDSIEEEYLVGEMGYFGTPTEYKDLFLRTGPFGPNEHINIGTGYIPVRETHWDVIEDEGLITVYPFGASGSDPHYYVGSDLPMPELSVIGPYSLKTGACNVQGIRIMPNPLIYRLPRGSVIVQALAAVKFSGLKRRTWSWVGESRRRFVGDGDAEGYAKVIINDGVAIWNSIGEDYEAQGPPSEWEPDDWPQYVEGAKNITFDIVGSRYSSKRVFRLNNSSEEEYVLPNRRLISGLGGISATGGITDVFDNTWTWVDVTRAMRTAYLLNDSPVQELHLVPSIGQPTATMDPETLGNFLQGQMNSSIRTFHDDFPVGWRISGSASGQIIWYDTVDISEIMIRFRIGTDNRVYQLGIPADQIIG